MRTSFASLLVGGLVLSAAVAACSGSGDSGAAGTTGSGGEAADAGADAPSAFTLRLEPATASVTVTLGVAPAPLAFRAFAKGADGVETDITNQAEWSADPKIADASSDGTAALSGLGGKGEIIASWKGVDAIGAITVKLTGDVFAGGADPTTKQGFDGAASDADPASAPTIEYPTDGVVLPGNLPPIEAQWSQAADNGAYRVRFTAPEILDVVFYTTARELLFPAEAWAAIAASAADTPMKLTVDGLGGGKVRSSAAREVTITGDTIDDSAIYVWQSSSGSFRVLDIIKGTDVPFPSDSAALQPGQPCSGCHRISRDGKRFSYTFNGGNFEFGALAYDAKLGLFTSKITPTPGVRGTYATFNPLEATTTPAMLVTLPDNVPQNTAGTVHLDVVDPETNKIIASNLAAAISGIDPAVGHATMMPDWSPNGDSVVFSAFDSGKNFVRLLGDDVVLASIVELPVTYSAATNSFNFGAPRVLVKTGDTDPDTGENNVLPAVSPDGSAVAFTRAAGWWSIKTQVSQINLSGQISVVRRSDGTVFVLKGASNDPGTTWSNTWPQWAPSMGKRWLWLAYGSERPYGHRLTPQSPENAQCGFVQGQKQCKHLWITAIDREKLAKGTVDPSAAPFFIPGQTLAAQYVSPQWTKAVIAPPQ
ncbi:MAG: hypothetical protein ACMG6S_07115 [Byssovorax sp.]